MTLPRTNVAILTDASEANSVSPRDMLFLEVLLDIRDNLEIPYLVEEVKITE